MMVETLTILVVLMQIFFGFPIALPIANKILIYLALKKNPQWVAAHPEFRTHKWLEVSMRYYLYLIAAANLIALIYYGLIIPSPDKYIMLAIMPLQIAVLGFVIFMIVLHFGLAKKIPTPEKITASLADRRLSAYVSPWALYPGLAAITGIGIYYVWAYFNGTIEGDLAVRRIIDAVLSLGILLSLLFLFLKRKYSEAEAIFGEGARKYEIWGLVALIYYVLVFRLDRFAYDFLGDMLFRDVVVLPFIGLTLQLWFIFITFQPKVKTLLKDYTALTAKTV